MSELVRGDAKGVHRSAAASVQGAQVDDSDYPAVSMAESAVRERQQRCGHYAIVTRAQGIHSTFRMDRKLRYGRGVSRPRRCVYVLRSRTDSTRYYTGVTGNWRARLQAHNAGHCPHTADGGPWEVTSSSISATKDEPWRSSGT
jgi:hypothetical protein